MAKHELIDYWIYRDPDPGVHVLFQTKRCAYKKCRMCSLWKEGHDDVSYQNIIDQITTFCGDKLSRVRERMNGGDIYSITIGNNGSILNPETFPPSAMFHCISRLWPVVSNLKRISLITEPHYISDTYLDMFKMQFTTWNQDKYAHPGKMEEIEFVVGLEALDENARKWIRKGYSFDYSEIESLVDRFKKYENSSDVFSPIFSLRNYVLLKPYPLTDDGAVEDVVNCVELGRRISEKYGVRITTHINPVYVPKNSVMSKQIRTGEIEYSPPTTNLIARTVVEANRYCTDLNRFCLGLSDEGLAEDGNSFVPDNPQDLLWKKLSEFNQYIGDASQREAAVDTLRGMLP